VTKQRISTKMISLERKLKKLKQKRRGLFDLDSFAAEIVFGFFLFFHRSTSILHFDLNGFLLEARELSC